MTHDTNLLVGVQHVVENGPNQIYSFINVGAQKDLKTIKKRVNWNKIQGENVYKCLPISVK